MRTQYGIASLYIQLNGRAYHLNHDLTCAEVCYSHSMRRVLTILTITIALTGFLSACTTAEEIRRPGGKTQYIIACGAALGWNICYDRANELCPQGYTDVNKSAGFNRKELTIECAPKP